MAIYPDISPNYGYTWMPVFKTDRLGPTDGDYTQRRRRRSSALYQATLSYDNSRLDSDEERELFEFFLARAGGYDTFIFYDFVSRSYPVENIGTGDGATTTWTLGYRDVDNETVYFDDVAQSGGYSISNRTGANGQDQIVFDTAPSDTIVITMKMDGKKYLPYCLFDKDTLASAFKTWNRHSVSSIGIIQVNG